MKSDNSSTIWKGKHAFLEPISFSANQWMSANKLVAENQASGDLMFAKTEGWDRLPIGRDFQVLMAVRGAPRWAQLNLESTLGILPVERGGTGLSNLQSNTLISVGEDGEIVCLTGRDNHYLTQNNGKLVWREIQELPTPSIVSSVVESALLSQKDARLILNPDSRMILELVVESTALFGVTETGELRDCTIHFNNVRGSVPISRGGTGATMFIPQSVIIAGDSGLTSLPISKTDEGKVLGVVEGRASWVNLGRSEPVKPPPAPPITPGQRMVGLEHGGLGFNLAKSAAKGNIPIMHDGQMGWIQPGLPGSFLRSTGANSLPVWETIKESQITSLSPFLNVGKWGEGWAIDLNPSAVGDWHAPHKFSSGLTSTHIALETQ